MSLPRPAAPIAAPAPPESDAPGRPVMRISWGPNIWAPLIAWDKRQKELESRNPAPAPPPSRKKRGKTAK